MSNVRRRIKNSVQRCLNEFLMKIPIALNKTQKNQFCASDELSERHVLEFNTKAGDAAAQPGFHSV